MKKLALKICSAYVRLKHPRMLKAHIYYIRDNYYSKLNQLQYFTKDFYSKKQYKVIDWAGEFQVEITYVLPFAYWHFLNGTLKKTISSTNTASLYFFSQNHEERYQERDATFMFRNYEIPNMTHSISKSYRKWARVPLKKEYRNDVFVYSQPILIIANKYNIEWDKPPINFIDIYTLDQIISKYKSKYQIIYNRPLSTQITVDNSEILDLNEYPWLKEKHPEVLLLKDLYDANRSIVKSFNHLQLMVYANADHFISTHGGTAALASYFEGTNIILSNEGMESVFGEYNTIFPQLSGARILHAKSRKEILDYLEAYY